MEGNLLGDGTTNLLSGGDKGSDVVGNETLQDENKIRTLSNKKEVNFTIGWAIRRCKIRKLSQIRNRKKERKR